MYEVFTVGGGEYLVTAFNAVAAWTGGGGWRSFITVVMVVGFIYSLIGLAFSLNWRDTYHWFVGATLIYSAAIVPTGTVIVRDNLDGSLAPAAVDNVPISIALLASTTSQASKWLTDRAQTLMNHGGALQYNHGGMLYANRLYEKVQDLQYVDPRFNSNISNYMSQCVMYDILLGQKSLRSIYESTHLLTDIGPGAVSRVMPYWKNDGITEMMTCRAAYALIRLEADGHAAEGTMKVAQTFFPNLSGEAARNQLGADLGASTHQFHGRWIGSNDIVHQNSLAKAFEEARLTVGGLDSDSFASLRADTQARNTYRSIAEQAMTWVPVLNIVLTIVFYAMFPIIFPLFLLPRSGPLALKGYVAGFFYLAAWPPLYCILHMFIVGETGKAMNALAPGGPTLRTISGIAEVNSDMASIAGFLTMSIPFLAAGLAKGAMAISGQATSMLAPAQGAAEAAANEQTTGNYAYGNISSQNLTSNMRQSDQWSTAPTLNHGYARSTMQNANGTSSTVTADGSQIFSARGGISDFAFSPSVSSGTQAAVGQAFQSLQSRRDTISQNQSETLSELDRRGISHRSGFRDTKGSRQTAGLSSGTTEFVNGQESQSSGDTITDSRSIGQGVSRDVSAGETYDHTTRTGWGGTLSAGGGGNGKAAGKTGKSGGGTGIGASIYRDQAISRGNHFGDRTNENQFDRSSQDRSNSTSMGESYNKGMRREEGSYSSNDIYSSSEVFDERAASTEQLVERARRLSTEQARIEEAAQSLSLSFSRTENDGFQVTDNMSQYVVGKYQEYADRLQIDAPSLNSPTFTVAEREARNLVVDRVLGDYVQDEMQFVESMLNDPREGSMVYVEPPAQFTESDIEGSLPADPHAAVGAVGAVKDGMADGVGSSGEPISEYPERIGEGREAQERSRQGRIAGASSLQQEHSNRTNTKWHSGHR